MTSKGWETLRARDVMASPVRSVRITDSVREAADSMARHRVSGLAVLDRGGRAVGVVTASDIVAYQGARRPVVLGETQYDEMVSEAGRQLRRGFHLETAEDERVRDIMTPRVIAIAADAPLAEVARRMHEEGVHRTFVEENGRIVGIVTAFDIARCIGREAAVRAPAPRRAPRRRRKA